MRLKNPLSYQSQENMRKVSDRADKACNFLNLIALSSILGSVYVSWVGINLDDNTFCRALWMACKAFLWQHTFEIGSNLKVGGLLGIFKKRFVLLIYYYDMYGKRMREWYATVYIIIGYSHPSSNIKKCYKKIWFFWYTLDRIQKFILLWHISVKIL